MNNTAPITVGELRIKLEKIYSMHISQTNIPCPLKCGPDPLKTEAPTKIDTSGKCSVSRNDTFNPQKKNTESNFASIAIKKVVENTVTTQKIARNMTKVSTSEILGKSVLKN